MARALRVFLNSDLRCGHEGLAATAKKEKINVSNIEPGEFVIFINAEKNKIKLYAANNVVAYLKLPDGGRVDMKTIAKIPMAFKATGRIDYDGILRETIMSELAYKRRRAVTRLTLSRAAAVPALESQPAH